MTYLEYRYIFEGFGILSVLTGVIAIVLLFRSKIISTVAYLTGITRRKAMSEFKKSTEKDMKNVNVSEQTDRLCDEKQTEYIVHNNVEVLEEIILIHEDYY